MHFYKLQATGNDFIFSIDEAHKLLPPQIRKLCDRHFGIGSDGYIDLRSTPKTSHFEWTFYNPDGSEAEMCGNAARATTLLIFKLKGLSTISVKTNGGQFVGRTETPSLTAIEMEIPSAPQRTILQPFGGRFEAGELTNTGVPHFVIPVQKLDSVQGRAFELAPFIFDSEFGPRGANLTFYAITGHNRLQAVTLERGVNDFTLSCGTGVIAAAQVYLRQKQTHGAVEVETPGGRLSVEFFEDSKVILRGPAEFVFQGSLL